MKKGLFLIAILISNSFGIKAQESASTINESIMKTIRLIYPQWQGGDIAKWITEVPNPDDASRGYYLGAQLLNFLTPDSGQKTFTVPITTDISERKVTDGVLDRDIIVKQTTAA